MKSDLRVAVDRMGAQQVTLAEWRTALEAALAEVSTLASVPQDLAEIARVVEGGQEAHLRSIKAMVDSLVRPLLEEWAQTRVDVANLSGKLDRLTATLGGGLSRTLETQGQELAARLELGQREASKLHQEVLTTHLEGIGSVQRQLFQTVDATMRAALEQTRQEQAARMVEIERRLTAVVQASLGESLISDVEALPEVLVGALGHIAEENSRQLLDRVEQMCEQNRQGLAELTRAASLQHQEAARALTSAKELASRDHEVAVKALTTLKRSFTTEVQAAAKERVAAMAALKKACERIEKHSLDTQRQESPDPDLPGSRLAEVNDQLAALQKIARSIDRRTAKVVAASSVTSTAKPPSNPRSRVTKSSR